MNVGNQECRQTEVSMMMGNLSNALENLHSRLEILGNRLQSIRKQKPCLAKPESPIKSQLCALAQELKEKQDSIDRAIGVVNLFLDELEV